MAALDPMREKISHQLQDAIDRLRADIEKVEVWAGALSGLVQPVPEYQADCDRYKLGDGHPDSHPTDHPEEPPRQSSGDGEN